MPSFEELVAYNRSEGEISQILGADEVIYQVKLIKAYIKNNLLIDSSRVSYITYI